VPGGIYVGDTEGNSRGYLDDACDGLVRVALTVGDRTLSAYRRIGTGPPTYTPDVLPIRTVADELDRPCSVPPKPPWNGSRRSCAARSRPSA
jgi:hypothetical protein